MTNVINYYKLYSVDSTISTFLQNGELNMYPQWILNNRDNYEFILKHNKEYLKSGSVWLKSYFCSSIDDDEGLIKLKQQYRLERLKKGRTDLEICFRAMEWTFQQLLSKTQSDYIGKLNAFEILKYCSDSRTTVNCLCHATVLTEVLLALGYAARKISCLPIDVVPFDNHVVTTVYIPSLKKWIMLDPSMCCYITDKDQNILSIPEIRTHLVNDKEVCICTYSRFSNLNISGEPLSLNQSDYQTYLYKNFFRFMSRYKQNSAATKNNDVFYMLIPKGYLPANKVQQSFIEEANVELRITDDETFFWGFG